MTDICFVSHVIDPFGVMPPACLVTWLNGTQQPMELSELKTVRETIITYEVRSLVLALRQAGLQPLSKVIEIRDALKLLSGLSKDQGGERRWDTFRRLAAVEPGAYAKELAALSHGRSLPPERSELVSLLMKAGEALLILWQDLVLALKSKNEWQRFLTVEIPVQQIFHLREHRGIRLDRASWEEVRNRTKKEKYDAYLSLASYLGKSPASITYQNVGKYLGGTDAAFLSGLGESGALETAFEIAKEQSSFARSFLSYSQARKDEAILLRIGPSQDRIFPTFECFGTVTGRIIVLNPALQSLRRRNRHLVAADQGKRLFYFDFAQFEPGILAHLSSDRNFIETYNRHDMYNELALALFGNTSHRPEAKRIFLSYCYGMPVDSIARLLGGVNAAPEKVLFYKSATTTFFSRFPGLEALKQILLSQLEAQGSVASLFGNRRERTSKGRLNAKEQKWALSQTIQGTASLIFKDALISLGEAVGSDCLLLPMHDAILLQLPDDTAASTTHELSRLMEESFKKWCPSVEPRVNLEPFA